MNSKSNILVLFLLFTCILTQAQPILNLDLSKKGVAISPTLYGIFFEDINHAADGGLYAELIRNRSFEDATTLNYWTAFYQPNAAATISVETSDLLNTAQTKALKLSVTKASASARAGVYNSGFWGINVVDGQQYQLTFFAKCDTAFKGSITASLEQGTSVKYAEATITGLTTNWQKFTCTLTASGNYSGARFVLSTTSTGTIWFDVVSLFPPTFKNRPNGCRADLAQLLADMHPKFMRFPGGCFVEGDSLVNRFQWKKTIGNIEDRPGHKNLWGYRTSDGMGYHEFLQLAEDINAVPLYVSNIGISHSDIQAYTSLDGYIQDALDALEYANGDSTTTYGAMRAANGHSKPFNIQFVEIGNENNQFNDARSDHYAERYYQFYTAIKAKYPQINIIGNVEAWGTDFPSWKINHPVDLVDEHYYRSPQWFINQYNKYDSYNRNTYKIYAGEYAVTSGCGTGNLIAALGEAVYMCGIEKNSDVVTMCSYAPIFVNNNDRTWNPDMIVYNASSVYCTPSYYVQKLFANNIGTVAIPVKDSLNLVVKPITGAIGLGTWATQADYSNVLILNKSGNTLFSDQFASSTNWTTGTGTWSVSGNIYSQTSTSNDCRSIANVMITDTTYTYTVKARKTGGNEGFLIIFGYTDSNNFYWWNIGGWGNTQHAIEHCVNGSKSTVASVSGSITSNVWYDIRIEVSKTQVLCYLNDVLIHTLTAAPAQLLYTSATLDESTDKLFLKVVNPEATDITSTVNLIGITATRVSGNATVLTSVNATDENSFNTPVLVAPFSSNIDTVGNSLKYTFVANSVTILKLNTTNTSAVSTFRKASNRLSIYPNPAKDFVYINGDGPNSISVQIRNLTSQTLIKKQIVNGKVDISALRTGMYILTAQQGNKLVSAKLMKE